MSSPFPPDHRPRSPARRRFLVGAAAGLAVVAAGTGGGVWYWLRPGTSGTLITPESAHELARTGQVLLIDIRRPDEWQRTGIAAGAHPLDMRRDDFIAELTRLSGGSQARPVALICAAGVRSRRLAERLSEAGFTRIIDIPEGMMGSRAGPGWLARDLPLVPYKGE